MGQERPGGRRRPPRRPPAPPDGREDPPRQPPGPPGRRGPNRFRGLILVGTAIVVAIVVIGLATGSREDLPWGAIIGVAVLLLIVYVVGRRQAGPPE